jgi:CTP synthase
VPLVLKNQKFIPRFLKRVGLSPRDLHLKRWQKEINKADEAKNKVTIGIAGKYYASGNFSLEDAYVSVVESVKIAAWHQSLKPNIVWIDTENIESNGFDDRFKNLDGLIVPGGFGSRGIDGKIKVIRWARENKIPFLGLCYGMQLAVVEFARNAAGLKKAHTTEVNPDSPHPVIHIMPDQEKEMLEKNYGATMRLGNWDCSLKNNTHAYDAYGQAIVKERHRHRYELNNDYREQLQQAGLILSGISPDDRLVEIIELPKTVHPFFVGTQFHPEFASQFMKPNPLFSALVSASKSNSRV